MKENDVMPLINSVRILQRIISEISCKRNLNDNEIATINCWLKLNENIVFINPLKTMAQLLRYFIQSRKINENEKNRILVWCDSMLNPPLGDIFSVETYFSDQEQKLQSVA